MDKFDIEDVLDAMNHITSIEDMRNLLLDVRTACGFANVVYHATRLPGCEIPNPILLLSYDETWVKRYVTENYFEIDPVVEKAPRGVIALDWSDLELSTNAVRHFFKEAHSYGVGRFGVTIPVRGPSGERALFSATSNLSKSEWEKNKTSYIRNCHLIAHFFHSRIVHLSGYSEQTPQLSRRERQCLRMIANGQQARAISIDLGISESAVRLYTKSARAKLRCSTLAESAVRASQLDII